MPDETAEKYDLRVVKEGEEYGDMPYFVLHSWPGGFEITRRGNITMEQAKAWREHEEHRIETFSEDELAEALSQLLDDGFGGMF